MKKEGGYEIPTGSFLGDWTDEVLKDHGPGSAIVEYVATAPKSYAYKVLKPDGTISTHVKSKGFTLDHATSKVITFDCMKELVDSFVFGDNSKVVSVSGKGIRRDKDHTVVTLNVPKIFRTTFSKRQMVENYCSVEYGF